MGVYSGIAQDNVTINSGTLRNVVVSNASLTASILSGTVVGNVEATAGSVQLRTVTAAELGAIVDPVNISGKVAGTVVFETTNNRLMVATGGNANSTWVRADGTNAVTPA
jgi:hypothetical protein